MIAKHGEAEDFSRALGRLLDMDENQRERLVQNALKTIEDFTPEAAARQTLAVYRTVSAKVL